MKKTLLLFLLLSCVSFIHAQFDNASFDFKRNSLRIAIGSRYINEYSESFKNYEIELERSYGRYLSASVAYNYSGQHSSFGGVAYNQLQVNMKYFPFTNFKVAEFYVGGGLIHNTVNKSRVYALDNALIGERYGSYDYGFQITAGHHFNFTKSFSLGFKAFLQRTHFDNVTMGSSFIVGYSF